MKKRFLSIFFALFLSLFLFSQHIFASENLDLTGAEIHLFASKTCPHCTAEKAFLKDLKKQNPGIEIFHYEVSYSSNVKLMSELAKSMEVRSGSVPFTVIGDQHLLGYSESSNDKLYKMIEDSISEGKQDYVSAFIESSGIVPMVEKFSLEAIEAEEIAKESKIREKEERGEKLKLAIFGDVDLKKVSLPLLTFMIALVDGFNPCAMWVLMFLISLLLGMKDKKRMWLLGFTFIFASAFVYFLFMVAWLNLFLFIGFITWVRVIIGLASLFIAYIYIKDYIKNKDGSCDVDLGGNKQKIFSSLKEVSSRKNLFLALGGIILLAFAVNLLELVCSAGLPAVYTQVLSMSDLPQSQYYLYILFYILIFMLDDMIVFTIAMTTLNKVGLNGRYARYAHLIGGILMGILGLAMIFKPELMMFG